MPRVEDIAWKFVVRQGKKWRCPYCKIEYSGSVTRVKSHFLKQPKGGIVSCTKVPEHISMLMESLQNQVDNKDDIAWKFVDRLGENKWHCHHCREEFLGDLAGVKGHLLGVPTERISICTEVPDHIRTLMRSLLDEVAEERSREAHGQSSMEPKSRDMPTQAEVAEEESREANRQFSTGPQSRDMLPPAVFLSPQSFEYMENSYTTAEGATTANFTSDHQQGERQFNDTLAMLPLAQNSHGNSQRFQLQTSTDIDASIAPQHTSDSHFIEATVVDSQVPEAATNTTGPSSSQVIEKGFSNREHAERHCIFRMLEQERIPGNVIAALTSVSHPPNVEGAINLQFPQDMPPLTQSHELMEGMGQEMRAADIANPPFDGAANCCSAPPLPNSSFTDELVTSFIGSLDLETSNAQRNPDAQLSNIAATSTPQHSSQPLQSNSQCGHGTGLVPPIPSLPSYGPLIVESILQIPEDIINTIGPKTSEGESISCSTMASAEDVPYLLHSPYPEEMQMSDQQTPTGASSFQYDQLPAVGNSNCLQDCNQHSQLQTPTDINPSIASQHIINSHVIEATIVDLQVPEVATNTTGPSSSQDSVPLHGQSIPHQSINLKTAHQNPTVPSENHSVTRHAQALIDMDPRIPSSSQASYHAHPPPQIPPYPSSSQAAYHAHPPPRIPPCETGLIGPSSLPGLDMNEGASMTSHPSTSNNFEENRALKRKLEILYSIAASMRDEVGFAASLSLKKLRVEVANWLEIVEKLRNDCTEAASEDCLPLQRQVDILMREAEDPRRQSNGLFEVRVTKANNLLEGKMVGEAFQRKTTEILDYLVGDQVSRLGIYGMGGVGKTTIMTYIHDRLCEKENYGYVLWITVSQPFNTQKLQEDICKELGLDKLVEEDVRKRPAKLFNCLTERGKSTIILDDVWEPFDLEEVGIPVEADKFKLVLTTRSFDVCCKMNCQVKIKIEPLSQKEAEILFMKELGSEVVRNLEIEAVMKSIVKECAGLPLGVITMARSMRGVTNVFAWNDILVKLKESDMGQTDMEKKVLMNLKFSYDRLGDYNVQQCFLSCALYPEDEFIDKFELIEFFIDQGLFDKLNTREKQYNRGLTILDILGNVCLLEDHGRQMKMHDLIRDMALHIMSETSIVQPRKWLKRIPPEECWTDALEKVSLMQNYFMKFPLKVSPNCPKLSTLLLNDSLSHDVVIPDFFFKQLRGLKVLNLSGCYLRELPKSISKLVSLRALLLRECLALHRIPYLGKLTSLRKLDASGCENLEVLEGLGMLVNLRYIDLTHTSIKRLPKGILGGMLNLQYLKVGGNIRLKKERKIFAVVNGEDITKLEALETLKCYFEDVDDFNKCVRVIRQRYYKLKVNQEESLFDVEVSDDARFGYRGRSRFRYRESSVSDDAQFGNRERRVEILGWNHAIVSVGGECIGIFILIPRDVQTLMVEHCDGKINLSGMGPFECLEKLFITKWENLGVLCGGQDEEVINIHDSPAPTLRPLLFPSLMVLWISNCPKLKYLFGHRSKFSLPNLQRIEICRCAEMVGIIAAVTSLPPCSPPAFPSLEEISVSSCDKMKRVVESECLPHFCSLRKIDAYNCANLEEIIGGPPPHVPVEKISLISLGYVYVGWCDKIKRVMEWRPHFPNPRSITVYNCKNMEEIIGGPPPYESVEEISLEYLDINWCPNMKRLFPQEWLIHLRNLGWIFVQGCNGMVEIISGAGQGQGGSIMTPVSNNPSSFQPSSISLPNLEWLCLQKLPQLKSICEVPITCDSLKFLRVNKCPELNRIPLQLQIRDIEHLPDIAVEDEEKWKSLIWDHPDPQATLQPYLHFNGSVCFLERPKSPSH